MRTTALKSPRHHPLSTGRNRSGSIVILAAVLMIFMMGLVALTVDLGYMQHAKTELDRAVDASALAGVGVLPDGFLVAESTAIQFAELNSVASSSLAANEITVEAGHWDAATRQFMASNDLPSAIRVSAVRMDQQPLFFANVFGINEFTVNASAVARFQPRDILVVLDYSASMNDDSEFKTIPVLGRSAVEGNILQIYQELDVPTFGTMSFAPRYMTVVGQAPSNAYRPQLSCEYRYNRVTVTSSKPFNRVRLYRGGSYKDFLGDGTWNSSINAYEQSLTYNDNHQVTEVQVRSGYNDSNQVASNQYHETFDFSTSSKIRAHARNAFQLNSVAYPYPSGSWDDYINYCRDNDNQNGDAGYFYRFGYLNLVNYWLDRKPRHAQTPDLWMTSEYPIKAVKNAVDVFLWFMQQVNTSDRVGLAIYNSSSGWGKLEQELTLDYGVVSDISWERQAGHYHSMTNIAGGLDRARQELDDHGRNDALKMIVLMTDGVPTYPQSTSYARDLAIKAAQACANSQYPIVTISLGTGADVALMELMANMTEGVHFNVPGGRPVDEYEEDLKETFRKIAEERPLLLVQ